MPVQCHAIVNLILPMQINFADSIFDTMPTEQSDDEKSAVLPTLSFDSCSPSLCSTIELEIRYTSVALSRDTIHPYPLTIVLNATKAFTIHRPHHLYIISINVSIYPSQPTLPTFLCNDMLPNPKICLSVSTVVFSAMVLAAATWWGSRR